jgi:hypothetical protein
VQSADPSIDSAAQIEGELDPGFPNAGSCDRADADLSPDRPAALVDLPPWPWPCSPRAAPAPRGLFPHQRFG